MTDMIININNGERSMVSQDFPTCSLCKNKIKDVQKIIASDNSGFLFSHYACYVNQYIKVSDGSDFMCIDEVNSISSNQSPHDDD